MERLNANTVKKIYIYPIFYQMAMAMAENNCIEWDISISNY